MAAPIDKPALDQIQRNLASSGNPKGKEILEHANTVLGYLGLMEEDYRDECEAAGMATRRETIEDLARLVKTTLVLLNVVSETLTDVTRREPPAPSRADVRSEACSPPPLCLSPRTYVSPPRSARANSFDRRSSPSPSDHGGDNERPLENAALIARLTKVITPNLTASVPRTAFSGLKKWMARVKRDVGQTSARVTLTNTVLYDGPTTRVIVGVCNDASAPTRVAVKIYHEETSAASLAFMREVSILMLLRGRSPYIVRLLGASVPDTDAPRICTRLCEGGSLASAMRRLRARRDDGASDDVDNDITLDDLLRWLRQLLSALECMHQMQPAIVHGDLKAHNLLLTSTCTAVADLVVCDFGRAAAPQHLCDIEYDNPRWLAPELLCGGGVTSCATDMYAVGVVIWEMCDDGASLCPYAHLRFDYEVDESVRSGAVPVLDEDAPHILRQIAARCLRHDPRERPSASTILGYLEMCT